jgi:hypothetical protein
MNKINWAVVVIAGLVALVLLGFGTGMMGGWGYGGWGMMGSWGHGFWPFGIGMFFMWLIPLGFIVLVGLGIAWLVKAVSGGNAPAVPAQSCPSCGRAVQPDWKNCPYCAASLAK